MDFAGRSVAVVGLVADNMPLIRYLVNHGANITVLDKQGPEDLQNNLEQLKDIPVKYHLGPDFLQYLPDYDEVYISPCHQPELTAALEKNVKFLNEMELFFQLSPAPIIGTTDSGGRVTTAALIGLILKRCFQVWIGGSSGRSPISFLPELTPEGKVVLELNSLQLQGMEASPQIAVITNVTPNQPDIHKDMAEYIDATARILRFQSPQDRAVLNWDNEVNRQVAGETPARIYYFSRKRPLLEGAFIRDGELILRLNQVDEVICKESEIRLSGVHNLENILAAALASRLAGASLAAIHSVVTSFTGVEDHLEFVQGT
ncbi:MAG TPA: Mur ligase family protein [Bacillota bacterium]|nr:Mur ligase family protein [Bacillota bacterium]